MPASIKRTKGTTFPTYFYEWQESSVERVSARSSFETGRNPWQRHQELPFNRGTCDLRTWHATKSERIRPNSGDDVTRWLVSRRPDEICESEAIRSFPFCSVFTLWTIARHTLSSTTRGSNRFHSLCFYGSTEETKPFRLATEALSSSICSIEAIRVRLPPQEDRKVFSMLNNDCTMLFSVPIVVVCRFTVWSTLFPGNFFFVILKSTLGMCSNVLFGRLRDSCPLRLVSLLRCSLRSSNTPDGFGWLSSDTFYVYLDALRPSFGIDRANQP